MTALERIESLRNVVRLYLPPDSGIMPDECLNKLIELLDGPGVFIREAE